MDARPASLGRVEVVRKDVEVRVVDTVEEPLDILESFLCGDTLLGGGNTEDEAEAEAVELAQPIWEADQPWL